MGVAGVRKTCLGIALLVTSAVGPMPAQEQSGAADVGTECRRAAQTVRASKAGTERAGALHKLVGCVGESGTVIPQVWRTKPNGSAELNWLVAGSVATRDARIFGAVVDVAENASNPTTLRLAALRVLASYGDPRVWVSAQDLASQRAIVLPFTDHPTGRDSDVSLPSDVRARVLTTFERLAQKDPNSTVREAALFLKRAFPQP